MKMRKENEKAEFCLNSRRWIETMAFSSPPKSCPLESEHFWGCQDCGYYELREPTNYLKKFRKIMKGE